MIRTALIGTIILLATAMNAHAGSWQKIAATCFPADPAIQGNLYTVVAGSVGNNGSNTSQITLYCPVSWSSPFASGTSWSLDIGFEDSNGNGVSGVQAELFKMAHSNGNITSVATASSDGHGLGLTAWGEPFTHTFDFNNYYYYVKLDIDRCDSGCDTVVTTSYWTGIFTD